MTMCDSISVTITIYVTWYIFFYKVNGRKTCFVLANLLLMFLAYGCFITKDVYFWIHTTENFLDTYEVTEWVRVVNMMGTNISLLERFYFVLHYFEVAIIFKLAF